MCLPLTPRLPPTRPALPATAISSSQVNLAWTASTDNVGVTGYRVERCQGSGCTNFTQVATPTGTTYSDTGLAAGTLYQYRVRAADTAGNLSGYSTNASATTQGGAPSNLSVTVDKAATTPVINGQLSESGWNLQTSIAKSVIGAPNNTATFDVLWDNTYLYVGVKVLDSNLNNDSTNVWDDDSVDIYIDANHSHSTAYDASDLHLVKGHNDTSLYARNNDTTGILHASAGITGGYAIEMAIPWSKLGVTPTANMTIGFDRR